MDTVLIDNFSRIVRRLLSEENGIDYERIRTALQWYRKHKNEQYIPVIESGRSLQEKFSKLEAAITREDFKKNDKPEFLIRSGLKWYLKSDGNYYNADEQMLYDI